MTTCSIAVSWMGHRYTWKLFMKKTQAFALAGITGLIGLTGCFPSVHQVPRVQTVNTYKTATAQELEAQLSARDAAIQTLNASVLITATTGGVKEGKVKTYTAFRGYIFIQKPRDLRVLLQLPVIRSKAMDMVSDGKTFTLVIPPRNRAIVGNNEVTKPSKNGLENLRPAVFLDSLVIPRLGDDEYVALTESTHVLEAARGRKPEVDEPDYDLAVYRVTSDHLLQQDRLIHISRSTLLPYEQDVFDAQGQVITQASYSNYSPAGETQFARLVTITRPLDEYSLRIEITKLTLNEQFPADQFELKIPPEIKVEHLD